MAIKRPRCVNGLFSELRKHSKIIKPSLYDELFLLGCLGLTQKL